jgi:hypothetical protein
VDGRPYLSASTDSHRHTPPWEPEISQTTWSIAEHSNEINMNFVHNVNNGSSLAEQTAKWNATFNVVVVGAVVLSVIASTHRDTLCRVIEVGSVN